MRSSKLKITLVTGVVVLAAATTTLVVRHTIRPANTVLLQPEPGMTDCTTPKGAVWVMLNSVSTGDTQQYFKCFVVNSDEGSELKPIVERLVVADGRFIQALRDRYGDAEARPLVSTLPLMMSPELLGSARVNESGDSATLVMGQAPPMQMQKVNGEWKVDLAGLLPANPSDLGPMLERAAQAVEKTTTEIRQKKYRTATEAVNAMLRQAR